MISHGKDIKIFTGNANPKLASKTTWHVPSTCSNAAPTPALEQL